MTDAVVSVGNPLMGDDGIGQVVVDELLDRGIDTRYDVEIAHAGTTALLALEAMSGADRAVVVDTVTDEAPPGTIRRFRYDGADGDEFDDVLMHDFSFADALSVGTDAYDLPDTVVLVGVVPATVEPEPMLSDRLSERVPEIVRVVLTELTIPLADEIETMSGNWHCSDCEEYIDESAVEDHEAKGHTVKGKIRPDRLISQDTSANMDELSETE